MDELTDLQITYIAQGILAHNSQLIAEALQVEEEQVAEVAMWICCIIADQIAEQTWKRQREDSDGQDLL